MWILFLTDDEIEAWSGKVLLPKVSQPICNPSRIWIQVSERSNMLSPVMFSSKWLKRLTPQWELWLILCKITYLTSQLKCLAPNSWELFYESYECSKLWSHWTGENKSHFLLSASTPGVPSASLSEKDVVPRPRWHPRGKCQHWISWLDSCLITRRQAHIALLLCGEISTKRSTAK